MDFQTFNYDISKIKVYLESVNPINEKICYLRWLLNEIRFNIKAFKNFSNNFRNNLKKIEEDIEVSLDKEKFKLHGVHRTLGETLLGTTKLFEIPDLIKNKMLPYERIFLQTSVTEYLDRIYNKENPYSNFVRNRLFKLLEEYWNEGKNGVKNGLYYHLISIIIHEWNQEISCDDDIKIKFSFPVFAFDLFRRFQNREQLSPTELTILKRFVLDTLICFMNTFTSKLEQIIESLNDLSNCYEADKMINSELIWDAQPEQGKADNTNMLEVEIKDATVKNKKSSYSVKKILDRLKTDTNERLSEDEVKYLEQNSIKSSISRWIVANYKNKLEMAIDRMTTQIKTERSTYNDAIKAMFKNVHPYIFELIDKRLRWRLQSKKLRIGKDGFVHQK